MLELRGGPAVRVGPLFAATRRLLRRRCSVAAVLSLAVAGLSGCATPGPTTTDPGAPLPPGDSDPPPDLLAQVRFAAESGEFDRAAREADSLFFLWSVDGERRAYADSALWLETAALIGAGSQAAAADRLDELLAREPDEGMRSEAIRIRSRLLVDLAREPEAAALLLANQEEIDEDVRAIVRRAVRGMSLAELSLVRGAREPAGATEAIVAAEYARSLALAGLAEEAQDVARTVAASEAEDAEKDVARAVLAGDIIADTDPVRVGAILPLTGRFGAVGRFLHNGMKLAVDEANARAERVELIVRDDGSDPVRAIELVRELESEGVTAILGPIRSQAFSEAVEARSEPGLLLVSPTATEMASPKPNAYTLWDMRRRTSDVAFEVGRWLASELGIVELGALVTDSPVGRDALLALRAGATRAGGVLAGYAAYSPDSTTFEVPIQVLGGYAPQAVFIDARDASAALQIGPQLSFYGLRGVLLVGGASWAEPAVVRRLDPSFANYRLVGTFVDQFAEDGGWTEFKRAYEITHRTSLRDNMLPALGHDALMLVLAALPDRGPAPRGAVSRSFARLDALGGASGELRPDPATSTVARTALVRMILDRVLVDPDPTAILARLSEAGTIESARTRRRRAEAIEAVGDLGKESGRR